MVDQADAGPVSVREVTAPACLSADTLRYYERQGLSLQVAQSPRLAASVSRMNTSACAKLRPYVWHNCSGLCSTLVLCR